MTLQYYATVTTTTTTTTRTVITTNNSSSVAVVAVMATVTVPNLLPAAHLLSNMPDLPADCAAGGTCSSSRLEAEDSSPSL